MSRSNFDLRFAVATGAMVVYDWVLTLGQEIELIWRQRWSLMTVLYLVIRYIGPPYFVVYILLNMPLVSLTDAVSNIMNYATNGTIVVVTAMLGGELPSCDTSVILTRLKHDASHHDCSVACHVSEF
ncbi:hypothetical protein BDR05DRAFT_463331 [Suillus weaverae]|nr:hypothetical protein BDR05DRAFT_463331 [Suillus weaverae]